MTQKADLALSILCFYILLDTNEDQNVQKTFMFLTEDMNDDQDHKVIRRLLWDSVFRTIA